MDDLSGYEDAEFIRLFRLGNWKAVEEYLRGKYGAPPKKKQFAFTFTTGEDSKLEVQKEMCEAAWKLLNQNTTPVQEAQVFLEYTEANRPHLHGWYETEHGGRIFAKTFKRCWPTWGETKTSKTSFTGGYHTEMKSNRYKEYASDEGRLVCSRKGTDIYFNPDALKWYGK